MKEQHKTFRQFGKEQPGIYTLFTPIPFVQITEFDVLKEAFVENGIYYRTFEPIRQTKHSQARISSDALRTKSFKRR